MTYRYRTGRILEFIERYDAGLAEHLYEFQAWVWTEKL